MRWVRTPERVREIEYVPWRRIHRYDRLHEMIDRGLVLRLAANMRKRGWSGPPLVVYGHNIGHGTLLTGVHRAAALDRVYAGERWGQLDFDRIPVVLVPYGEAPGVLEAEDEWSRADVLDEAGYTVAAELLMLEGWH